MSLTEPTVATRGQWCFRIVAALDDRTPQLAVRFQEETTWHLVDAGLDRRTALHYLKHSLRCRAMITTLLEEGRVLDLGGLSCELVVELGDSARRPHATEVRYGLFTTPHHLDKQHPRYEELHARLTQAVQTRQPVWCALQGGTIAEVFDLSPQQHDALVARLKNDTTREATAASS